MHTTLTSLRHVNVCVCVHVWCSYFRLWGKQCFAQSVHVVKIDLYAGVCETQFVEAGGIVFWTDVTLSWEWRNGDGVLQLGLGQIITDPTIHITLMRKKKVRDMCKTNYIKEHMYSFIYRLFIYIVVHIFSTLQIQIFIILKYKYHMQSLLMS